MSLISQACRLVSPGPHCGRLPCALWTLTTSHIPQLSSNSMSTLSGEAELLALAQAQHASSAPAAIASSTGHTQAIQLSPDFLSSRRVFNHLVPASMFLPAHSRSFSEGVRVMHPEISEEAFHDLADNLLERLQEKIEMHVEALDVEGSDVEMGQGVLTIRLGEHGTYVINKQTPNRQIWMSSPVSGPFRFDHTPEKRWIYSRDGRDFVHVLQEELCALLDAPLNLEE